MGQANVGGEMGSYKRSSTIIIETATWYSNMTTITLEYVKWPLSRDGLITARVICLDKFHCKLFGINNNNNNNNIVNILN